MQSNTIIVTDNNVLPTKTICVCVVDTNAEPALDESHPIDYDTLTQAQKDTFDAAVTMIESLI